MPHFVVRALRLIDRLVEWVVIALMITLANLVADLVNAYLDPRIRMT